MYRQAVLFLFIINWVFLAMGQTDVFRQSLQSGWQLHAADTLGIPVLDAMVPGSVQADLLINGLLPDPFYGTNEKEVQWVSEHSWRYSMAFDVDSYDPERQYVLHFDGLDTYAKVMLNGQLVLETDNMFRVWRINVGNVLKATGNELAITFVPPMQAVAQHLGKRPPYEKTATNDTGTPQVANMVRKAQYHFGWDWGLRLVTMGIWKPVYLESFSKGRIQTVHFQQKALTTAKADMEVAVQMETLQNAGYTLRVRNVATGELLGSQAVPTGASEAKLAFTFPHPAFWWPRGQGEQHLYEFACELWHNDTLIDQQNKRWGFRTVELVQEPDSLGESFYFRINGRPVFVKGGSYIPQDILLSRVSKDQKKELLEAAANANMNLVRIWGGGIYESDDFYDTCDSLGLMIWQDFMFACAAYPDYPGFHETVAAEVRDNIQRLRHHPCIITWCGNNEVFMAMQHWGWQKNYNITSSEEKTMFEVYRKLFQGIIPDVLAQEDPQRPYSHTTPNSNWWKAEGLGRGTLHYWGVWHGPDDFSQYSVRVGRYMNEYGFQSFPDMETIAAFAEESQWDLESEVMKHHQKSYVGNGLIGKFTKQYGKPASNFQEFVEQSQWVQYEAMRHAILSHRLHWGYCMGTTFWQLDDCWPAPSWSAIDYYGRPKVFFQKLPDLFASVTVTPVTYRNKGIYVAILNDAPFQQNCVLSWRKETESGTLLAEGELPFILNEPGTVLLPTSTNMAPGKGEVTRLQVQANSVHSASMDWRLGQELPYEPKGKDLVH